MDDNSVVRKSGLGELCLGKLSEGSGTDEFETPYFNNDFAPKEADPNAHQVGGTHYGLTAYQHWDLMADLFGDAHFVCSITRYITRWRKKDGIQGLEKALHYTDKLISLWETHLDLRRTRGPVPDLRKFLAENGLSGRLEALIFQLAINYQNVRDLHVMRGYISLLLSQARKGAPAP